METRRSGSAMARGHAGRTPNPRATTDRRVDGAAEEGEDAVCSAAAGRHGAETRLCDQGTQHDYGKANDGVPQARPCGGKRSGSRWENVSSRDNTRRKPLAAGRCDRAK